ncbi:hypothetical protein [Photobacterium minamisatsumaniensis]|uniref:hypothetical protein n=1 Tax=Photobacterium minamisatsumaniensis TaxID=2910233 RepID=UPI003D0DD20C
MSEVIEKRHVNSGINLIEFALVLFFVSIIALISNWAGAGVAPTEALLGMFIIYTMVLVSLVLAKYMPFYLPSVAWISIVSVGLTLPIFPAADWIVTNLQSINFLSLVTPVLAYSGLAISKLEIDTFKKSGFKIVLISILVFTGTFIGSAFVANILL